MVLLFSLIGLVVLGTGAIVATSLSGVSSQGMLIAVGVTAVTLLSLMPFVKSLVVPAMRRKRLMADGVQCPATILAARDTGVSVNGNPQALLRFLVTPPDGTPFECEARALVPRLQTYLIQPGRQITVAYDPSAPGRAEIVALSVPSPATLQHTAAA